MNLLDIAAISRRHSIYARVVQEHVVLRECFYAIANAANLLAFLDWLNYFVNNEFMCCPKRSFLRE